jgi:hypothetical protein
VSTAPPTAVSAGVTISETEAWQIDRANAERTPVVFVDGLWLLPSSWDRRAALFEEAGYTPRTPRTSARTATAA